MSGLFFDTSRPKNKITFASFEIPRSRRNLPASGALLCEVAIAFEALGGDRGRATDGLHWRTGGGCDVDRDYRA
jgi:hypothetical protein